MSWALFSALLCFALAGQAWALSTERRAEAPEATASAPAIKRPPIEGAQVPLVSQADGAAGESVLIRSLERLLLLLCGLTIFSLATGIKLRLSRRVLAESGDILAPGPQPLPGPSHLDTQMR